MTRDEDIAGLFDWLTRQPETEAAIANLPAAHLRELLGYLARLNVLTGIPGEIYGHALVEAAKRFQQS